MTTTVNLFKNGIKELVVSGTPTQSGINLVIATIPSKFRSQRDIRYVGGGNTFLSGNIYSDNGNVTMNVSSTLYVSCNYLYI